MRRMRCTPQGIQDGYFNAFDLVHNFDRDYLAIAQIYQLFFPSLGEKEAIGNGPAVRKVERGYFQIAQGKRSFNYPLFWHKVTLRPRAFMECIDVDTLKVIH